MDVRFARRHTSQAKGKGKHVATSDFEGEAEEIDRQNGEFLDENDMISIEQWEIENRKLTPEDADNMAPLVAWCYAKWVDLQYEQGMKTTTQPCGRLLMPMPRSYN